ncbi:MAG: TIGR03960 family B12-binding radical SAM protein, partial [Syntrophomonadaceae bacterium]|nr:TIGR03960 family B12-binding radical SAM protein [Syntrophomonadaceae bacterium]
GPAVFNPEPFADFFDLFVIGDGEEALLQLLDTVASRNDLTRKEILLELSQIEGFYIPSLYNVSYDDETRSITRQSLHVKAPAKIRKRTVKNLDQAYFPAKPIVSYLEVVHDRAVLEIMRGCQRGCRFCQAGMVYRPVRERNVENLTGQAGQQLKCTGYDEISLTSLSTLDYSGIKKLVNNLTETCTPKGIGISLPSLRVDRFSIELAEQVQKVRKTTLTLAPEAGSQRLRNIINKNVTSEQLYMAAEAAFKSGWLAIKLYFMIGLPGENEEDLEELLNMLKEVKRIGRQFGRRMPEIKASCAIFVPKAHTPFQWQPQVRTEDISLKKAILTKYKIKNIKLNFHDSPTSYLEGLIARGDRRMSSLLFKAWQNGCRFDSWTEFFNYDNWRKALDEADFDLDDIIYRRRSYAEDLPWDFIDIGVSKDYLQEEAERSLIGETTADCRYDGCNNCNVCTALKVDLDIKETSTCA